jgi:hypothetical protein
MDRICIYPKDIQIVTGRSERYGRNLIKKIKEALSKQDHQFITIEEFCQYTGLSPNTVKEKIRAWCCKPSGNANQFVNVSFSPTSPYGYAITSQVTPLASSFAHATVKITRIVKQPQRTLLKGKINDTPVQYMYAGKEAITISVELAMDSAELLSQ